MFWSHATNNSDNRSSRQPLTAFFSARAIGVCLARGALEFDQDLSQEAC